MIAGLPLRLPMIDIHTVGAGGGSIAFVDNGGALQVGPRSPVRTPGPACYGRGGTLLTVTDANLVLGRLVAEGFLGGGGLVHLDLRCHARVLAQLGEQLGLSPEEAALGVVRVANATMERALRAVSVNRVTIRAILSCSLLVEPVPLHACDLAARARHPAYPLPGDSGCSQRLRHVGCRHERRAADVGALPLLKTRSPIRCCSGGRCRPGAADQKGTALGPVLPARRRAALDMRYRGQS